MRERRQEELRPRAKKLVRQAVRIELHERPATRVVAEFAAGGLRAFPQQAGQEPGRCPCFRVGSDFLFLFFPPANVKLTGMLKGYNGGTFQ
jgi:hypothetical protein